VSDAGALPPFDILVVGGGINGAVIACDAAGRGLATALVEERDFGEGTSSRSSKLIHGGLRYLETFDLHLVREALIEREILLRKAPHLVWPLRLVLPHVPRHRPKCMIRLGLLLYDHLAPRMTLDASCWVDFRTDPLGQPLAPHLREGFAYSDCRGDDARLVIANVLKAKEHGATILARTAFRSARRDQGASTVALEDPSGGADGERAHPRQRGGPLGHGRGQHDRRHPDRADAAAGEGKPSRRAPALGGQAGLLSPGR
jgi:glycerol-3-phosphate dehydrogenase